MKDIETYIKEVYEKAETMPIMEIIHIEPKRSILKTISSAIKKIFKN